MGEKRDPEQGSEKKSNLKRAWHLYRLYDRVSAWFDWHDWLSSFLKTKAGIAAATATAAVATTAAVVAVNVLTEAPLPAERQTQGTIIFAIEGKDKAQRRGTFDVVVAKKEFLWVRKSSDELEREGKAIPGAEIADQVFDVDVRAALTSAREIVAVGTASQEGDATEETERAGRRARKTAEIVAQAIASAAPVWTLNLGQYREPCKECEAEGTNWQRPFMVIAVKELEAGANLGEALADAMSGRQKLPSPSAYSAFELTKFR
jgi:hypothetical protein